ncbi:MAG: transferrin-binding protein-like solute binding protein [Neisseriaceae bacterium]|nr:transferrin-binding protein-like solute binding protein [Neisseriaceae bacterium]
MNAKFFTLTAISLLALTACGGGGGGSDSGVSTTQPTTGGDPVGKPLSDKYADTVSGKVIVEHSEWVDNKTGWKIYDYQISDLGSKDASKKDLNSFKITSGKTTYVIELPKKGDREFEQHGNFVANVLDMGNGHEVSSSWGTNLSYARYGLVYGDTDHIKDTNAKYSEFYGMFHQGYLTDPAGVPTAGIVNYTGEAIVWNGQPNIDATGISKNATFKANFTTKQFTGDIKNIVDMDKDDKVKIPDVLNLSGKINGNKISGTNADGTVLDAAFYGPNVKEVAGSFVNKNKVFEGAFGAKRTDK